MSDDLVSWFVDLEKLRRMTQRYARAVDARDIDAVAALFHPDGVVDGARGSAPVPAYIAAMRDAPRLFESGMHVLGDPLIDLEPGADHARMDTYAVVYQFRPSGSTEADLILGIRYLDDMVRHGDQWLIHHRQAVNLWTRQGLPPMSV
jgi:hypothetical protein